jgi:hypothetical protein
MSSKKSKERVILEERLIKYGLNPLAPEFNNLGRLALKKKVKEIYQLKKVSDSDEKVSDNDKKVADNEEKTADNHEKVADSNKKVVDNKPLKDENKTLKDENKALKDAVK